jgi:hypothetical protein
MTICDSAREVGVGDALCLETRYGQDGNGLIETNSDG